MLTLQSDADDPYKCNALLNRGQWLDPPGRNHSAQPFQHWQPPGCMMHQYKRKDIQTCMKNRRAVYIGDSTVRQIFWATARKLDKKAADEKEATAGRHMSATFVDADVKIEFVWDPFLNSSVLRQELNAYNERWTVGSAQESPSAGMITIGAGLWFPRYLTSAHFRDALKNAGHLTSSTKQDGQISTSKTEIPELYLTPVQTPLYESLSPERASFLTPPTIDSLNGQLRNVSIVNRINIPWSFELMTLDKSAYERGGIHVTANVASRKADVLLNMACNAKLTLATVYPVDKTCCAAYDRPSLLQAQLFLIIFFILRIFFSRSSRCQ